MNPLRWLPAVILFCNFAQAMSVQKALLELTPTPVSYSETTQPSVAVVRTQSLLAEDPIYYSGLQLGLVAQPYSPQGAAPLVTLGQHSLEQLEDSWLVGLEARLMPWVSELLGRHSVGFRVGGVYAKHKLEVSAPSGEPVPNTHLHSLQTYALLSQEWFLPFFKNSFSLNADVGVARFDALLTSTSTLAEVSDNAWLTVVRAGPAWRLKRFSVHLNFEHREHLTNGWARMSEDSLILGLLYGVR